MKLFSVFLGLGLFLVSCGPNDDNSKEKTKELLNQGQWELVSSEKKTTRFQSGLKFSEDKQVFYVDSQGHIIPPHHKNEYSVSGDTLKIVDYRYEPQIIYDQGTDILIIKELNEEKMVLEAIHPEGPNELVFEKR